LLQVDQLDFFSGEVGSIRGRKEGKMKKSILVFAIMVGMVVMAGAARADVVFTLDTLVSDGTNPQGAAPYGTVTLADNGFNVDVSILLYAGNNYPYVLSLNYIGDPGSGWTVSGGNTVTAGLDSQGYNGWFDIRVVDADQSFSNPLTFTLSKSGTDLSVLSFVTKDETGNYYTIVRDTLNASGTPSGDSASNFYGARTAAVPEPSTLLLLGSGLLGLVGYGRKRMRK
jgi:hypothetical protein